MFREFPAFWESHGPREDIPPPTPDQSEKPIVFRERIPSRIQRRVFPSPPPTAVATEIQQNFSDGFSFPTPCFLFLRYGAVAMRLETDKFFGLKLLEED
ncbi:hypothetical protein TNCV_4758411 [Trichonephila clavipes]|nr:hypothetical protein TNCV_4758411 [Trichonephila clavipes]